MQNLKLFFDFLMHIIEVDTDVQKRFENANSHKQWCRKAKQSFETRLFEIKDR